MVRAKVIKFIYFSILGLIILRLGYWQIIKTDELTARAEGQRLITHKIAGQRGSILFSDNSILASMEPNFLVFAQPQQIKRKFTNGNDLRVYQQAYSDNIAKIFWEIEQIDNIVASTDSARPKPEIEIKELSKSIFKKLNQELAWVSLGEKVDIEGKKKLEDLKLSGLGFEPTVTRIYPEGSSSAHLLGFVGSNVYGNDTGYLGLEGFYNGDLNGKLGSITQEKDALGLPILIGKFLSREPKPGKTLVLSIDRSIQHISEQILAKNIEKYGAKGGSVIVMDPKTGNILAMAAYPNYDPGNPTIYPKEYFRNPSTADGYEPGSTFKVLIMAGAINEGLVKPETTCDICNGPLNISGYSIRTWDNNYHPNLTMTDVIIHSDNTGMVFISKKLGIDKLYEYIKRFGIGQQTGIDLQDERPLGLRSRQDWKEIDLATASFGQGISVSAIQLIRAVATIANGGFLMEPHVVSSIIDKHKTFKINPKIQGQPITKDTAKVITEMMIRAVDEGETKFAKTKGYKIAGKTGTAQIPIAGHYDLNKTIASFVGFAPANDPKFVMLVRFDQPTSSIYGAETAAPTFFEISKELFNYYGIPPTE